MNRIINFHDVEDRNWFESVLLILKRRYNLVPMSEIESSFYMKTKLVNACHITIDDGCNSFYDNMYPVLKKHNVPATIFISPQICKNQENFWFQEIKGYNNDELKRIIAEDLDIDLRLITEFPVTTILKTLNLDKIWEIISLYRNKFDVGQRRSMNMSIEVIKEINNDDLITIGAHTMSHPILSNETRIQSEKQIKDSINDLSAILDKEIKYFAYPNGTPNIDFGSREIEFLKDVNVKIAVSTDVRTFTKKDDPLSIPRISLGHGSKLFVEIKLTLGRYWEVLKKIKGRNETKDRLRLRKLIDL